MDRTSMETRAMRMKDAHDIENLLCRYSYYLTAGDTDTMLNMFARKTNELSVTLSSVGAWRGRAGLERFYGFLQAVRGDGVGQLEIHLATNFVINVSADRSKARAVLVSPGVSTGEKEGDHLASGWEWAKAEVELIQEDGAWKFSRMNIYDLLYAPYGHTFVGQKKPLPHIPEALAPDAAETLDCAYAADGVQELRPVPPGWNAAAE